MVDSVQILDAGFRVTDANDNPVNNAKIKFREVGPGAVRTVYSDADLTVALGNTVRTRSDGFPVVSEGSNTTVLIYTGNTPYNVEITDSADVPIFPAKDNVKGALNTSTFLTTGSTSTLSIPVVSKAINYTVLQADRGKLIAADATAGFITMTLPSAITVGDGWNVEISNVGGANQVGIAASQNIGTPIGNVTAFALRPGETCWIKSNGSTFEATAFTPPYLHGTVGVIRIADRLSDPPGAPAAGARYIVGAAPTGAWSTFAQHDIAESNGQGGWLRIIPAADAGWVAYVEDEDAFYSFQGAAWVAGVGSAGDTRVGSIEIAVQSEMEAASSALLAVTPGRQHFHPGHPKAGGNLNGSGTPAFRAGDYGMGAVTDNGLGDWTLALDTAFADTNYWLAGFGRASGGGSGVLTAPAAGTKTASSIQVVGALIALDSQAADLTEMGISFWGDYA